MRDVAARSLVVVVAIVFNAGKTSQSPSSPAANGSSALVYPGDIYVALLVDLHRSLGPNGTCDDPNPSAVQQLWAAVWALETLNNQTEAGMPKLGLWVYDTCGSASMTLRRTIEFLQWTVPHLLGSCPHVVDRFRALGVVGIGEAEALRPAQDLLQVHGVPLILATSNAASGLPPRPNVLTTAPTMASTVRAVVALLEELHWKSVHVLSSSEVALLEFGQLSADSSGPILRTRVPPGLSKETLEEVMRSKEPGVKVIVLMLEPAEVDGWVRLLRERPPAEGRRWIVAVPSLDDSRLDLWSSSLRLGFVVAPHPHQLRDFRDSFLETVAGRARRRSLAIDDYVRKAYRGAARDSPSPLIELERGYRQDENVPFVGRAMSAMAAALRVLQIDGCDGGARCSPKDLGHDGGRLFAEVLSALKKLSFTVDRNEPMEVEGTRFGFTDDGKLVFRHFDVYAFDGLRPVQVGWYGDDVGLHLNPAARLARPYRMVTGDSLDRSKPSSPPEVGVVTRPSVERGWTVAVVVAAGLGLVATAYVFACTLARMHDRASGGDPFLGMVLSLGAACLYGTSLLFAVAPSEALCHWRLFLHSFAYAVCYGTLLLEAVLRRPLRSADVGDRPSHLDEGVTLFFVVGVQVALNVQWSVLRRPSFGGATGAPRSDCFLVPVDFVVLQAYVLLLLLLAFVVSLWARRFRGPRVLLASSLNGLVWMAWVTIYLLVPLEYRGAPVCGALVVNATVVVSVVFCPKWTTVGRWIRETSAPVGGHPAPTVFCLHRKVGGPSPWQKFDLSSSSPLPLATLGRFGHDSDDKAFGAIPKKK